MNITMLFRGLILYCIVAHGGEYPQSVLGGGDMRNIAFRMQKQVEFSEKIKKNFVSRASLPVLLG